MINGLTLLLVIAIVILGFAAFQYRAELKRVREYNEILDRANRELLLKNLHLLDDLDNAIEVIASEGAKRRHPTSKPALSMINGSA
jgi:hypothetical protein